MKKKFDPFKEQHIPLSIPDTIPEPEDTIPEPEDTIPEPEKTSFIIPGPIPTKTLSEMWAEHRRNRSGEK